MKTLRLSLCLFAILWACPGLTAAPLGTAIVYNGQLNDSDGPATGLYDLVFTLRDAVDGGNAIGVSITNAPVAVTNSLFAVSLDFGSSAFDGNARWLEIGVRTNGSAEAHEILSPAQGISPQPYALFANTAMDLLNGSIINPTFIGTTASSPLDFFVNNERVLRLDPTTNSPNLIGGFSENSVLSGFFGGTIAGGGASGARNEMAANFGTIGGGLGNLLKGEFGTISGGRGNILGGGVLDYPAASSHSTIGGGAGNVIVSHISGTISGGESNVIHGGDVVFPSFGATIAGGVRNTTSKANFATIGGGEGNSLALFGDGSTIAGGRNNVMQHGSLGSAVNCTIGGGMSNSIGGGARRAIIAGGSGNRVGTLNNHGAIGGGEGNQVNGSYGAIAGGLGNLVGPPSSFGDQGQKGAIGGGEGNFVNGTASTISGGENNNTASAHASIGGGLGNAIGLARFGTIAGGNGNSFGFGFVTDCEGSTMGGGVSNRIFGTFFGTISGGFKNRIAVPGAVVAGDSGVTIAGGLENSIDNGEVSTISGGHGNWVWGGHGAVVAGGLQNYNGGSASTISGGKNNRIEGDQSFVSERNSYSTIGGGWNNNIALIYLGGALGTATIAGGINNSVRYPNNLGTGASIGGGESNAVRNSYGTISGGLNNGATNEHSTVSGGNANIAGGAGSSVGGGIGNVAAGDGATIPGGAQAKASNHGQMAYASGQFAVPGDAQTSVYVCRNTTATSSLTELFLDGSSQRMVVPENATWGYEALIAGRTATGVSAAYRIHGTVQNTAGAVTLVGSPTFTRLGNDAATASWDAVISADDTSNALVIKVAGTNGSAVRWVASVRTVEVTF